MYVCVLVRERMQLCVDVVVRRCLSFNNARTIPYIATDIGDTVDDNQLNCLAQYHSSSAQVMRVFSRFQHLHHGSRTNLSRFFISPSHLSASTLRSVQVRMMTCQCLRSSAISVVISRYRHLSFGLPRFLFPSTVICNIFLVASSLSRLCTCPNHLNLFSLRNTAIGYMCASFQMSTFLTWSSLVFPLAHRSMRISVVRNFLSSFFLTAQHSAPWPVL